jgi:hypothetical protein
MAKLISSLVGEHGRPHMEAARSMSVSVKVCGCRPGEGGAAHAGAGVRKPPREETAGGVARRRVRRYGDFGADGLLPESIERLFGKRSSRRRTKWLDCDRQNVNRRGVRAPIDKLSY